MTPTCKIIDVDKLIQEKNPTLLKVMPSFVINYLKKILHEDDINQFLLENKDKVKALFLSHGHIENIGAVPEILKEMNMFC